MTALSYTSKAKTAHRYTGLCNRCRSYKDVQAVTVYTTITSLLYSKVLDVQQLEDQWNEATRSTVITSIHSFHRHWRTALW